ncbi:MAG TPA: tetratricopeptide repeat protein [Terriglobales bacterium]|nr:tetratricopeptide repeat protein [Terriglobales bacterium]
MPTSPQVTMVASEQEQGLRYYLKREPLILAVLSALAVVSFLGVSGLTRIYRAQQQSLGNRWFTRGVADLKQRNFERAVNEFRTALLYSRDNYDYQLDLAEGLIGLKRTNEAAAYLVNLWERQPENGLVNLELARIAVQRGETEHALRYYHNGIYAIWPGDQEVQRREARLELIEYLLSINAKTQAQAELIALAENLADDPSQHVRVADLFLQAQDYEHALAEYRQSLKLDRHNPVALAGAGRAAFALGRYDLAQHYLETAEAANPNDAQSAALLNSTELVLKMDPFRRQISVAQRHRMVIKAFAAAGERLKSCSAAGNSRGSAPSATSLQSLADTWEKMKPEITEQGLRRNPDLVEAAMTLVFDTERQTNVACGAPTGVDMALLLISKLHEGN